MNDRFAAQLRQHLLETGDDRPADGQLASIIDGVAATKQRHPLAARLTWDPGRVGLVASAGVRYGLIVVALALATVTGASLGGGAVQPSTVFEGTWITIDPGDGSGMTLVVGRGPTPAVYFEDGYATGAACVTDAVKRFTARGSGEISDERLMATFPDGGGCGSVTVRVPGIYDYHRSGDVLTDQDGVVWTRALAGQPETQASDAPASTAVEPDEAAPVTTPRPDPDCIQFDAPGTYTAPVRSLSLTVAVPGTVADPWNGNRGAFSVMRAACTDWSGFGGIDAGVVSRVDTTACAGGTVEVQTTADVIAAVSVANGIDVIEQTDVAVGGYAGTRFDIRVHDAANPCPDLQIPLVDGVNPIDAGLGIRLFLVDVGGTTLALGLYGYPDWDPALRTDVDGVIASMRIDT